MPRRFTFKGGIHPPHNKHHTKNLEIAVFPAPAKVIIPLLQHVGTPAKPVVKRGDRVTIGQVIGEAGGFISSTIHSSISGTIASVGPFPHPNGKHVIAVEIDNDWADDKFPFSPFDKWRDAAPGELIQKIQAAGIIGMGGAGFPTHVKLSPPSNKPIDTLIINGSECEPYLTSDHRLMIEQPEDIMTGILILKKIIGTKRCVVGIEENKSDAIKLMTNTTKNSQFKEISVACLQNKYPQGGEKQLINAITGRSVPSGSLPMDVGCSVINVATALAIKNAIIHGTPLYERVVTVSGPTVRSPKNYLVRIGTPIRLLLEACNTDMEKTEKVIIGGPMMGIAQSDLDAPVIKSTSGIIAYNKTESIVKKYPCINCGNCVKICPIHLVPSRIAKFVDRNNLDDAIEWDITNCIECGSCSYVCPSKINLVHYMKLGKFHVQNKLAANK